MRKKLRSIGIITVGLLLTTGCGKSGVLTQDANETDSSMTNTDVAECKKGCDILYKDANQKEACYDICETAQKVSSSDIEDCKDVQNTTFVTEDICIQSKAIQHHKPEYCELIEDENIKDSCYLGMADEMNDKSLCSQIKNSLIQAACESEEEE